MSVTGTEPHGRREGRDPGPGAPDGGEPLPGHGSEGDGAPAGDPDRPDRWYPVTRYLAVLAAVTAVVWYSANHLHRNARYPGQKEPVAFTGNALLEGWMRWDGGWYVSIAADGYWYIPGVQSSVAFFPAYPLAMRAVQWVVRDPGFVLPGILVTVLAGLGATVAFHRWCRRVLPAGADAGPTRATKVRVARTAVLVLLLFPYAWYLYGAVYADALFLASVTVAFLLLERDRPVLAGLVAVVATAGRPVGAGVMLGLVAVTLERRQALVVPFLDEVRAVGWRSAWRRNVGRPEPDAEAAPSGDPGTGSDDRTGDPEDEAGAGTGTAVTVAVGRRAGAGAGLRRHGRGLLEVVRGIRVAPRRLRVRDAGVLLGAAGLGAWMWYLAVTFGSATAFIDVQSAPGWSQPQGPRTWFKVLWLSGVVDVPDYVADPSFHWDRMTATANLTVQAFLVVGALCLLPAVVRRVGWGYAAYVFGVVAIPLLGSKDWQGTGRYLLAAFPVFLVAGGWLADHPRWRRVLLPLGAAAMAFGASGFARGFYLA